MCAVIILLFAAAASAASAEDFYSAIRNNDLAKLRELVKDSSAVNVPGRMGTTPLMYAATFGSIQSLQILLDAGADVNAKNAIDATALIYGVWDPVRTRLLIDKGADVNARSKMGRTPLIVAAAFTSSGDTPHYLLSKGANATGADGNAALIGATRRGDLALCKLLIEQGADVKGGDRSGMTPLHQAAASNRPAIVRLLLDHGADPNAVNSFGGKVRHGEIALKKLTPLMLAAPYGDVSVAKTLIDAGADINARDVRGMTSLMMALASDHQNKPVAELLIARGADVNARSLVNETALDWARKYHYRSTENFLQKARAQGTASSKPQVSFSPAGSNAEAASRGIAVLQKGTVEFFKQSGCYGCHHQTAAAMASRSAAEAGLSYNPEIRKEDPRAAQAFSSEFLPLILQGIDLPGSADSAVFILTGLDAAGSASSAMTDALASYVAGSQRSDGSWWIDAGITRAPMEEGNFSTTARAVLALKRYGWSARQEEFTGRVNRARQWLLTAKPQMSYEAAERLLGLKWADASPADLKRAATHLITQQRSDGGWAQNSNLKSDAYATGLALWSLYEAGVLVPSDASYRKGIQFLRKTQCEDGSWYVASRSPKFQPYFESGFPHGHDQWISSMATAYAVMALAPAVKPVANPRLARSE